MNRPKTIDEALDLWGGKRPEMLPEGVTYYDNDYSIHPDQIRVSFSDGTTLIYDLRVEQPAPIILDNIKIIRRMKKGYVNNPARRRRRR